MSYLYSGTIRSWQGLALAGREVTVYDDAAGTSEATLVDADGDPIANPTITDDRGRVEVYSDSYRLWYKVAGDGRVMRLVRFCDLQQTDIDGLPVFDVTGYGADGDGVTDDAGAIQDAVDACAVSGGVVLFPPGVYLLSSAPILPPIELTSRMVFSGYGATLKLSGLGYPTGGTCAFRLYQGTAHQTFQHIVIEGFNIDANNITAYGATVIETFGPAAEAYNTNIDDLIIRDVYAYNIYCDGTGTHPRAGIRLLLIQAAENEATQNYIKNVLVSNVRLEGGNSGIGIAGTHPAGGGDDYSYNNYLDNIIVENCYHDTGWRDGAYWPASNFHIGSTGHGGSLIIRGCYGAGSGDVGVEVNAFERVLVEGCTIVDCSSHSFYQRNFSGHAGFDPKRQRIVWHACHSVSSPTFEPEYLRHWCIESETTSTRTHEGGHYTIRDCSAVSEAGQRLAGISFSKSGSGALVVQGVTVENFDCRLTGWSIEPTTTLYPSVIRIDLSEAVVKPPPVSISGLRLASSGTRVGASAMYLTGVLLSGDMRVNVDGVELDIDITNSTTWGLAGLRCYGASAAEQSGVIRNVRVLGLGDDANAAGIQIDPTAALSLVPSISVEDCYFPTLAAGYGLRWDRTQTGKVLARGIRHATAQAPAGVTVKATLTIDEITAAAAAVVRTTAAHGLLTGNWCYVASTDSTPNINGWRKVTYVDATHFSVAVTTSGAGTTGSCQPAYTNLGYNAEDVVVTGGTVTKIELSTNDGANFTDTGLTAGLFHLRCGDILCITNSSAPTVTRIPRL